MTEGGGGLGILWWEWRRGGKGEDKGGGARGGTAQLTVKLTVNPEID